MKMRIYFNIAITALSIFLATFLLHNYPDWPLLYLLYFASTFVVTVVTHLVRIHIFNLWEIKLQKKGHPSWKGFLALFLALIAFLFIPILLTRILDPKSWFILVVSLTSGISIADILFYIHTTLNIGGRQPRGDQ